MPIQTAMRNKTMEAQGVIKIHRLFTQYNLPYWIDGGWGVDALLEDQTREHEDLDIVMEERSLEQALVLLKDLGFVIRQDEDYRAWNFVMESKDESIDFHIIAFDEEGRGIYGPPEQNVFYPADAFGAVGRILGQFVPCLSPEFQMVSHQGYELRDKDHQDMERLCEKFPQLKRGVVEANP